MPSDLIVSITLPAVIKQLTGNITRPLDLTQGSRAIPSVTPA